MDDMLSTTLASDADTLRRALRRVISDAQDALNAMEQGSRPGTSMSGGVLSASATEVEQYAARVNMLLNWAGSPILPNDAAIAALKGN